MAHKRAHVFLPENLLSEVDRLVGQTGRSAFLPEVVGQEVQRRKADISVARAPLFQSLDNKHRLTAGSEPPRSASRRKTALRSGRAPDTICNRSFRGTGVTVFLQNGGLLEAVQDNGQSFRSAHD